jgi:autotransporter-associated beta strand protein
MRAMTKRSYRADGAASVPSSRCAKRKLAAAVGLGWAAAMSGWGSGNAQAATYTWITSTGGTWQNSANWSPSTVPGASDVAELASKPSTTGTSTGIGIDLASAVNNSTFLGSINGSSLPDEAAGAIWMTSAASATQYIGAATASAGYLTLNGATVNSVANTILEDDNSKNLHIQAQTRGSTGTLGLVLGGTSNIVQITNASGSIIVATSIDQASGASPSTLTLYGAGNASSSNESILELDGISTYTGGTVVGNTSGTLAGAIQVDLPTALPTAGTVTVNNDSNLILHGSGNYGGAGQALLLYGAGNAANSGALRIAANADWQGTTTLESNVEIDATGTNTGTLLGAISDGTGYTLTKGGAGTLDLTASNTLVGGTTVGNGILMVASGSSIGTGTLTMGATSTNSGTLQFNNGSQTVSNLNKTFSSSGTLSTNTIVLNSTGLTINQTSALTYGNGSFAGQLSTITGNGSITLSPSSTATLTLSGTNTYTGSTNVNGGTLNITGSLANTPTNVNGGVLLVNGSLGTGAVTLGSTSGPSSGTLTSGSGSFGIGGSVTVDNGAVITPGGIGTLGTLSVAALTVNTAGILDFDLSKSGSTNLSDLITTGGALALDGAGTINLAGISFDTGTYTLLSYGSLSVSGGTLTLGSEPSVLNTAYKLYFGSTAITLDVTSTGGDNLVWSPSSYPSDGNGTWTNGGGNFYDTTATSPATYSNTSNDNVTFGSGGAGGSVTLSGAVIVGGNLSFQTVISPYTITASAGSLTLDGNVNAANSATINAPLILGASGIWDIASGQTLKLGGSVAETGGSQSITKTDSGTLVLGASNSYSGGTAINGGVVSISADNNLGASAGSVSFAGGTLLTTAGVTSSRTISLGTGGGTINTDGFSSTLNGTIGSTGALTVNGSGTVTLTASNSYAGGTNADGATLVISNDNQIGNSSGTLTIDAGGALPITSSITSSRPLAIGANNLILNGALTTTGTGNIDLAGGIAGGSTGTLSGNLTVGTGGSVTVGGANSTVVFNNGMNLGGDLVLSTSARIDMDASGATYGGTGQIYVLGNTDNADSGISASSGALASSTAMITNAGSNPGGTVTSTIVLDPANNGSDLTGNVAYTPGSITGSNYVFSSFVTTVGATTSGQTFTVGDSSHTNGIISGNGDVIIGNSPKTGGGAGTLILNGASTYTGNTLIDNAGPIVLGTTNALPTTNLVFGSLSGTGTVTLDLNGNSQQFSSIFYDGYEKSSSMLLTITNSSGTTGTLSIGGSVSPLNNFGGILAGNLDIAAIGSNTTRLSGSNTYTGGTYVGGGTLLVTTGGSINGTTGVTVNPIGTTSAGSVQFVANANTSLPSTIPVIVNNNASAIGSVYLNGTSPTIYNLSGTGDVILNNAAGTALTLGNSGSDTFAGVIADLGSGANNGSLTIAGSGTVTFTGTSTYGGSTTVNSGTLNITRALANSGTINVNATSAAGILVLAGAGAVSSAAAITGTRGRSFQPLRSTPIKALPP